MAVAQCLARFAVSICLLSAPDAQGRQRARKRRCSGHFDGRGDGPCGRASFIARATSITACVREDCKRPSDNRFSLAPCLGKILQRPLPPFSRRDRRNPDFGARAGDAKGAALFPPSAGTGSCLSHSARRKKEWPQHGLRSGPAGDFKKAGPVHCRLWLPHC